ncbi:hypothetical protein PF002_g30250 [Phytophthora fragariae]|uniref:LamG-like jellyroll fold domain-containing protein n=1 Tax=Phytophthora fragariae TaxID=53985 RepID=A0A6A3VPU8_9STRA|nr:hypothetical protein PF003_g35817 [Phytophthora fragariae]KAE9169839.1 hypothetical protein PF002_g30250 [Phytophthora fragariae]
MIPDLIRCNGDSISTRSDLCVQLPDGAGGALAVALQLLLAEAVGRVSIGQSRVPALSDALHAAAYKALYQRTRSLGFTGLAISDTLASCASDSYSYIRVSSNAGKPLQLSRLRDTNFSFDLWFALLPQDPDEAYTGGILYGLQSVQVESRNWPQLHQQFVLISATGDLYCSVLDHRPVVKSGLQIGRWYHLALSYDCTSKRQEVYLDGAKIRSDTGALHRELQFLKHEQVGTGCITANGLEFPKPGYLGWYGFHGLIDEFRVWGDVLTEGDVAELARGQNAVDKAMLGTLKSSGRVPRGVRWNVCEVRCSRPLEGRQVEMAKCSSRRRIAVVRPEQLPADTIAMLCSYLTGFDAFNLSHTNFWWMQHLADGSQWQKTARSNENGVTPWKERYMLSRSMLFRGLQSDNGRQVDSYAYLTYAGRGQRRRSQFRLAFLGSESFSLDVWFSLLPASDGRQFEGIIYGLQSASRESRQWPYYHQQFVLVSSTGDLYCSVLDSRPVVASNLESNRWYHVALTYDNEQQRQDVYLDGKKIHSTTGALHDEWGYLSHEQVGTGCITAGGLNFPRPKYLGWMKFRNSLLAKAGKMT